MIQCAKCAVWWNWATMETGKDQRSMKDTARYNGTLWMPGELQYQMRLQQTNLPEFIALLERSKY